MLNDEVGYLSLKKQLVHEKIEKRALLAKFASYQFDIKWTDKDRKENIRKNIYDVKVGLMPQRSRPRSLVEIEGRFGVGEGLY